MERVTHICVSKLSTIGSDNGLSPGRRQAIIWTSAGILLIKPLGTNFSESFIEILIFSFKKMPLNVSSAKWRPFCLGLNVLMPSMERVIDGIPGSGLCPISGMFSMSSSMNTFWYCSFNTRAFSLLDVTNLPFLRSGDILAWSLFFALMEFQNFLPGLPLGSSSNSELMYFSYADEIWYITSFCRFLYELQRLSRCYDFAFLAIRWYIKEPVMPYG